MNKRQYAQVLLLTSLVGGCSVTAAQQAPAAMDRRAGDLVLTSGMSVCPEAEQGQIDYSLGLALEFWNTAGIDLLPCDATPAVTFHHAPDADIAPAWAVTSHSSAKMPQVTISDSMYRCLLGGTAAACNPLAVSGLTHELGHAMGLGHTMTKDSIMYAQLQDPPETSPSAIDLDLADCLLNTDSAECSAGY